MSATPAAAQSAAAAAAPAAAPAKSAAAAATAPAAAAAAPKWVEPKWDKAAEAKGRVAYWWAWTFEDPSGTADPALLYELNDALSAYKAAVQRLIALKEASAALKRACGGVLPDERDAAALVARAVDFGLHTLRASADAVTSAVKLAAQQQHQQQQHQQHQPSATAAGVGAGADAKAAPPSTVAATPAAAAAAAATATAATATVAAPSVAAASSAAAGDSDVLLAVRMFVDAVLSVRATVTAQAQRLDTIQNTPNPELSAVTNLVATWRARMEDDLAPRLRLRIPWPLFYVVFRKPDADADASEQQRSDFEGGAVVNKDGTLANQVRCALLGHVVQYWDHGKGTKRYHCMQRDADHSAPVHELVMGVRRAVESLAADRAAKRAAAAAATAAMATDAAVAAAAAAATADAALLTGLSAELTRLDPDMMGVWVAEVDMCSGAWLKQPVQDTTSPAEFVAVACRQYRERLCVGVNDNELKNCVLGVDRMVKLNGYSWLTFGAVGEFAHALAVGLRTLGVPRTSCVGICGANQPEWLIGDFACALAGCVIVGIHTTFDQPGLRFLCHNAQLSALLVSRTTLPLFCDALHAPHAPASLRHVIVWEDATVLTPDEHKLLASLPASIAVHHLQDVVSGKAYARPGVVPVALEPARDQPKADDPNALFTLLYTSGSTGVPKGVEVTKGAFRNDIGALISAQPLVGVSYIPLSHSSDRVRTWEFLGNGGRVGFARYAHTNWAEHEQGKKHGMIEALIKGAFNNVHTLMSSVKLIEPLAFAGPPRIWNGLYNVYHTRVAEANAALQRVLALARDAQLDQCLGGDDVGVLPFLADGSVNSAALARADAAIRERARQEIVALFGRRLSTVATGGAPTSPEVMAFIRYLFPSAAFHESYGATEVGAITEDGRPRAGVELKLVDVPSRGFTSADRPYPRGEIVVRTTTQARGYYAQPDLTADAFVADDGGGSDDQKGNSKGKGKGKGAWFRTGDLGLIDEHNRVHVLERVSAVTSLRGGLFLCPSKLEALYESSPHVQNVFVYADPSRASVVAVVQPSGSAAHAASADVIRADFVRIAADKQLRGFEVPSAVHVSHVDWSVETGLLNVHHKKMRTALAARFKADIEALYAAADATPVTAPPVASSAVAPAAAAAAVTAAAASDSKAAK